MIYYLIGSIGIFIIGIILCIIGIRKEQSTIEQATEKQKQKIEQLIKEEIQQQIDLEKDIKAAQKDREIAMQRAAEAQAATERVLASEQGRLAAELQRRKELDEVQFEQEKEKRQQYIDLYFAQLNEQQEHIYKQKKEGLSAEIEQLQSELDEWKNKQDAINQEIRRQQELEDSVNFHRIQLKESDKSDIHFLLSIEDNINNKELLHKLIWTEYIQRPFNQMINSVFGSKVPKNVIYCIEDINTHKKYIGKTSAEVSKRWTDHIKNSLNIGTIKRQNIHDALYNHWDEFTFTIIEEVKDDKLGDREKFYINFFQTDKYGFNIKSGG